MSIYSAADLAATVTALLDMANWFDRRAFLATEQDHRDGKWGDWRHDAAIMMAAAKIINCEVLQQTITAKVEPAPRVPSIKKGKVAQ